MTQPELLILDAPLGVLNPRAREDCWDDLRRVHAEAGITTLVLTDDPDEALALADHLAVMDLGRIVQVGPAAESYNRPADVFVARLLGPTNLLQGQVENQGSDLRGEVVVSNPSRPAHRPKQSRRTRPGDAGDDLDPTGHPGGSVNRPGRLEPLPGDHRGDPVPGRPATDSVRGPGDWPIMVSVLQSQSQGLREGQSFTLSVAPEHVVVLPGKFALGGASTGTGGPELA